jgi:NADH-quinone oxidoreductase subunit A
MGSLDSYLPIFLLLLVGIAFASGSFAASKMLSTQRPTSAKEAPYECGIVPEKESSRRFPVRFYLIAMIFIVFDVEIIFLFPWAVVFGQLGRFGLVEIIVFAATVFISFVYLLSNGALDWGPIARVKPIASDTLRTTASTVRRVPRPGRETEAGGGDSVEAPAAVGPSGGEAA